MGSEDGEGRGTREEGGRDGRDGRGRKNRTNGADRADRTNRADGTEETKSAAGARMERGGDEAGGEGACWERASTEPRGPGLVLLRA